WRVGCVRIPRFPIGAVLRQDVEARAREEAGQLALPLGDGDGAEGAGGTSRQALRSATAEADAPWAAARREAPRWPGVHWDELPLALADASRLRAVTVAAGRRRVRAGMTLA